MVFSEIVWFSFGVVFFLLSSVIVYEVFNSSKRGMKPMFKWLANKKASQRKDRR